MSAPNQAQIDLWKGRVGENWAALQGRLDVMLAEVTAELIRRAGPVAGLRVLDVGCGAGVTCAAWLAGGATVTGVDVSTPMLAVAQARTGGKARLIEADASVWRGEEAFDLAVSQFGVMFFDDPGAAFANIVANVRPGGRLLFACWRSPAENPWSTGPVGAIRDLLPPVPAAAPTDTPPPGPFAFADGARVSGLLAGVGFQGVTLTPFDFRVCFSAGGGAVEAADLAMRIGPSSAALAEAGADETVRAAARERLQAAFAPHDRDGVVAMPGAIWIVEAVRI